MKKFLRKLVNRGAPKGVPFLVLLAVVGVLATARARPAEAAVSPYRALCYDDLSKESTSSQKFTGFFKERAQQFEKKYGVNYDYDNKYVYVQGRKDPIDLSTRIHGKSSPYRYWFWIKENKHLSGGQNENSASAGTSKSGSVNHWNTDYFIATTKKVDGPNFNAVQYKKDDDAIRVERLVVVSNKKLGKKYGSSLINSMGSKVGDDHWGIDFYMIDLKQWFNKTRKIADDFSGSLYLQTIPRICYSGGGIYKDNIMNIKDWRAIANQFKFRQSGIATYPEHYNQRIYVGGPIDHYLEIYRMHTSKNHAVAGDLDSKGMPVDECKFGKGTTYLGKKKVPAGTIVSFDAEDILTYKEDGKTYYLKGIREKYIDEDDGYKAKDYAGFSIYDNLNKDPVTGTEGVKTNLYAKVGDNYTGIEKDTISNRKFWYSTAYMIDVSKTGFSLGDDKYLSEGVSAAEPDWTTGGVPKRFKGAQTWQDLAEYMARDLSWKNTVDDNRIYLVYQELPSTVTLVKKTYEYDDETDQHECNGNETTKTWDLKKGNDSYSIAQLNKEHKSSAPMALKNNNVSYYARWVDIKYTDRNGKKQTLKLDINEFPQDGKKFGIYSGKNSDKEGIEAAVAAMFKKASVKTEVNSKVKITIKYYQPKTPTALVGYYQFYDENGDVQRVKLFESIDKDPSNVNSGKIGKSGVVYNKVHYLGFADVPRRVAIGKIEGKWVRVTNKNKGVATDIRVIPLVSNKAYQSKVKGYHDAKANQWGSDKFGELVTDKNKKSIANLTPNKLLFSTLIYASLFTLNYGNTV